VDAYTRACPGKGRGGSQGPSRSEMLGRAAQVAGKVIAGMTHVALNDYRRRIGTLTDPPMPWDLQKTADIWVVILVKIA
jgi:hypothetical protein